MNTLRIRLFGKFQVERDGYAMSGLDALKVQELFCYLLLNRDRPHHREALAGLLWGEYSTSQSKKYLRQALWQLQLALGSGGERQPGDLLMMTPRTQRMGDGNDTSLHACCLPCVFLAPPC